MRLTHIDSSTRAGRRARAAFVVSVQVALAGVVSSASAEDAPRLPSYINAEFAAAIAGRAGTAPPAAGSEFRSTAALAGMIEPAPASSPAAASPAVASPAVAPAATPAASASPSSSADRHGGAASEAQRKPPVLLKRAERRPHTRAPHVEIAVSPQRGGKTLTQWPAADIALARARCAHILASIDAVAVPEPPLREGECGTPAPVRLVSVGRKPQVKLTPAPLLTCDMVEAVHDWMKKTVQPAARKHLRSEITEIEVMSDYSCRNAYGRARTRLSEHGHANALDVRGFVTAKAEAVSVLDNWGLTGREIAALHARQRMIAEQRSAPARGPRRDSEPAVPRTATAAAPAGVGETAERAAAGVGALTRATIVDGIAQARIRIPGTPVAGQSDPVLGLGMSRLGGPKPTEAAPSAPAAKPATLAALPPDALAAGADGRKALFLRQIHAGACSMFGTVLGPEANNAHRNHLHIDMAMRATGAFCQ